MGTPIDEKTEQFPDNIHNRTSMDQTERRNNTSIAETLGTQEQTQPPKLTNVRKYLTVETAVSNADPSRSLQSPSQTRERAHRLDDDLAVLAAEQEVFRENQPHSSEKLQRERSKSVRKERSRRDTADDFVLAANPVHERAQIFQPAERPGTGVSKFFKRIHGSSFLVRYFMYIVPVALIILIPLLIGALLPAAKHGHANVAGVSLLWFCVWLEIVWLTLWAGRILAKCLPAPFGLVASLFTNNAKKWKDMAKQLELSATLFFWWLGIEISFLPTMKNHHVGRSKASQPWEIIVNKILVSFLTAATLNFIEKFIIQLIAISFHQRTYEDRIVENRVEIECLTKLYSYSKLKLAVEDSEFEEPSLAENPGSGAVTPGKVLEKAQKATKHGFNKFGDVAGKIAGDFTGREITQSSHPSQVVLELLSTNSGSQVLARRLYRTFANPDAETIEPESMRDAFELDEQAETAFVMFDRDMNGDITMEELETACVAVGKERKAILASLKDLDSVVSKLDNFLTFTVVVVAILVLIALISSAAAEVLGTAGAAVLALSWLLGTSASELLQSIIFVFVKHPFDVGDRVTIYGNAGSELKGDDYIVKEIALLYTEFKKLEGHIVQAPNSALNTLFILNQRRSPGVAEAVPITFKYGTTVEQIDQLQQKLLKFVTASNRDYQPKLLTELREIQDVHSITLNIIFFYKTNWQNELLRLRRRNTFFSTLMITMQELGIEGPNMRFPGQRESFPLYMQHIPYNQTRAGQGGTPDAPNGRIQNAEADTKAINYDQQNESQPRDQSRASFESSQGNAEQTRVREPTLSGIDGGRSRQQSRTTQFDVDPNIAGRHSGESRPPDFSLGIKNITDADMTDDVFEDRRRESMSRSRVPASNSRSSQSRGRPDSRKRADTRNTVQEVGHSSGRAAMLGPGHLHRRATEEGRHSSSLHRNRFFPRQSHEVDHERQMESGMAGIPENGSPGDIHRIDPRSGLISPQAWRRGTNDTTRGSRDDSGTTQL